MLPNIFGETIEDRSIAILREFEPPEGYYGAFSGGKDSVVLKEVTKRSGVKVDWHYNVTTIDPPEIMEFIRDYHPDVAWEKPERSFFKAIRSGRALPTRVARWCCEELKEHGGVDRILITGVRAAESVKRKKYGIVHPCLRFHKTLVYPILHWTDDDVWRYIRENNLPYCSLYDEGFKRLGCILCPFESNVERARQRWPRVFDRLLEAISESYPTKEIWQQFGSPEGVMDWWLDRSRPHSRESDQEVFPFDQFGDEDE